MKQILAIMAMLAATNSWAQAERILEFPKSVDGMLECMRVERDLAGEFKHPKIVGGMVLYVVRESNKFIHSQCGPTHMLSHVLDGQVPKNLLDRWTKDIRISVYDPRSFDQLNKDYEQRQRDSREAERQQRQELLKKYGL